MDYFSDLEGSSSTLSSIVMCIYFVIVGRFIIVSYKNGMSFLYRWFFVLLLVVWHVSVLRD